MQSWFSTFTLGVKILLCLSVVSVSAQDVTFFDCPDVRFFGPRGCAEPVPELLPPPPVPQAPSVSYEAPEVLLFPRETLAPTTPPLMVDLLENPTLANAIRFRLWERERVERRHLVEDLLRVLTTHEGVELLKQLSTTGKDQ